jgi:hypothetical protein
MQLEREAECFGAWTALGALLLRLGKGTTPPINVKTDPPQLKEMMVDHRLSYLAFPYL